MVVSMKYAIRNMTNIDSPTVYNENLVLNILKLMNAAVEGHPPNVQYVVQQLKISETIFEYLNQNQYIDLAGQTCLITSQLIKEFK